MIQICRVRHTDEQLTENTAGLGNEDDRLPDSAQYNANLALQYDFPLVEKDAFVRGDLTTVGDYYDDLQEAGLELGEHTTVYRYVRTSGRESKYALGITLRFDWSVSSPASNSACRG